jgi:predicted Fe-S protein YdhL (DUF1289 family)
METPCINICSLDPLNAYCTGCYRTIDEITGWSNYSQSQRQTIMDKLPHRSARHASGHIEETLSV